jgi:hypothetical protein
MPVPDGAEGADCSRRAGDAAAFFDFKVNRAVLFCFPMNLARLAPELVLRSGNAVIDFARKRKLKFPEPLECFFARLSINEVQKPLPINTSASRTAPPSRQVLRREREKEMKANSLTQTRAGGQSIWRAALHRFRWTC